MSIRRDLKSAASRLEQLALSIYYITGDEELLRQDRVSVEAIRFASTYFPEDDVDLEKTKWSEEGIGGIAKAVYEAIQAGVEISKDEEATPPPPSVRDQLNTALEQGRRNAISAGMMDGTDQTVHSVLNGLHFLADRLGALVAEIQAIPRITVGERSFPEGGINPLATPLDPRRSETEEDEDD